MRGAVPVPGRDEEARVGREGTLAPMPPTNRRLAASSSTASLDAASPLAVMTDPLCVCVLDVLEHGARAVSQLVAEASRRLGPSAGGPAFVASRVALLVASGFVEASEPPPGSAAGAETVLSVAERRSCELLDALAEAVAEVRDAGDVQQEQDLVDALETAWAARDGRRSGLRGVDEFRASEAGRRHARRVAEGTLGQPGSPFAAG